MVVHIMIHLLYFSGFLSASLLPSLTHHIIRVTTFSCVLYVITPLKQHTDNTHKAWDDLYHFRCKRGILLYLSVCVSNCVLVIALQ